MDGSLLDITASAPVRETIELRLPRAARVIGVPFTPGEAEQTLRSLGFGTQQQGDDSIAVTVPTWRHDVEAEVDLLEELARVRGYDSLPTEIRPFRPGTVPDSPMVAVERRARAFLVGAGLMEVRPMPFVRGTGDSGVRLANPLSEDEAYLRSSLMESLVKLAEYNVARLQRNVRLFEIGTVFPGNGGKREDGVPLEEQRVAALIMGKIRPVHFTAGEGRAFDEWDAKAIGEALATSLFNSTDIKLSMSSDGGLWNIEFGGSNVGLVARLEMDVPVWAAPAFGIEIILSAAAVGAGRARQYLAVPATPPVEADFALLVPSGVTAADVEAILRADGGDLLESVALFDEFRGKDIPAGFRSLAWRLTFRHPERTLKDKEVQGRTAKILRTLESRLGVRQRTS